MKNKFGIVCCENIRKEVDAALSLGEYPDLVTRYYTTHCMMKDADTITPEQACEAISSECDRICLFGCGCFFNLQIPRLADMDRTFFYTEKGAALFLPSSLVEHYTWNNTYLVTPGWLSRWQQMMACQDLSQTTAREMFGESIREIILVDTGTIPEIGGALEEFAQYLDLPASRLPVGLDFLRLQIESRYYAWAAEQGRTECNLSIGEANRKSADYAMVFDLLGTIAGLQTEEILIGKILELYTLLFSPGKVSFIPNKKTVSTAQPGISSSRDTDPGVPVLPEFPGDYEISKSGDGFFQAVQYNNQLIGIIAVEQVAFPEHLNDYLNISQFAVQVCGLALSNAQVYQKLTETLQERDNEIIERIKAEEAARTANKKLNLLSGITRHDINNQLTVLMGFLGILEKKQPDPSFSEYFKKISTAAERISAMIMFTKTYESIGVNAPAWQDIRTVVNSAADDVAMGDVKLINDVPPGSEVFADPLIIKVFFNLMDNAIRYGGKITTIRFSFLEGEGSQVILCEDNGNGVVNGEKEKIFLRGFGKNTGLGLFLSREILSITGLSIRETGEEGKGARFEITGAKDKWRTAGRVI